MQVTSSLKELGFTQYEAACYMGLVSVHPINGSRLSKISGVARSRIYDVLRNMAAKGWVLEVESGQYVPLPPDELVERLRHDFETSIAAFEKELAQTSQETVYEYIWTLTGYENIMNKAVQMIRSAENEIYVRLFPQAAARLAPHLKKAESRGVNIRFIAMGEIPLEFDVQVIHPEQDVLQETIGGRSFDIITDRKESLVGIFETGNEDNSPISWTRNHWFVTANRDSLRHDFYHCFLEKTYDRHIELSNREKRIYRTIKQDN